MMFKNSKIKRINNKVKKIIFKMNLKFKWIKTKFKNSNLMLKINNFKKFLK